MTSHWTRSPTFARKIGVLPTNARPSIGNASGVILFAALSVLTVAAIAWATRGRWRTGTRTLDWQLVAVCVGTFLVSYHSHMHGLVLLTVPLAGMWTLSRPAPLARLAILGFIFGPTLVFFGVAGLARGFVINYDDPLWVTWPVANVAMLAVLLAVTLLQLRSGRSPAIAEDVPGGYTAAAGLQVAPNA